MRNLDMNTNTLVQEAQTPAPTSTQTAGLTRRDLLVRSAVGGGFMVGCMVPGVGEAQAQTVTAQSNLTAWIVIGSDETVTLQIPATEMGQGIMTGFAQIMADELRVAWNKIRVVHAPVDAAHGGTNAGPWGRFTGGSLSTRLFAPGIQQAAANARAMLVKAASDQGLMGTLTASNGTITNGVASLSYGALAPAAAKIVLSGNAPRNQYPRTFVGTSAIILIVRSSVPQHPPTARAPASTQSSTADDENCGPSLRAPRHSALRESHDPPAFG